MKQQGAAQVIPQTRVEARDEAERVKEAVRGSLRMVKSRARLRGEVSDMVRDFVRGRQASPETAFACIGVVLPQLSLEAQVAFWHDLALRITCAPLMALGGSVTHSWIEESDMQTEGDKAQLRGVLAVESGSDNVHDLETAEIKTLAHAFSATQLALRFRAARVQIQSRGKRSLQLVRA